MFHLNSKITVNDFFLNRKNSGHEKVKQKSGGRGAKFAEHFKSNQMLLSWVSKMH